MHLPRGSALALALSVLALLAGADAAPAQGGRAQLRVIVSDTLDQPVPGARVLVTGLDAPVLADSGGVAHVTEIPLGSRLVTVRQDGYGEERAVLEFPSPALFQLRVVLTPQAFTLDTLNVTGERFALALHRNGFYRRRLEGLGKYLTRREMDELATHSGDLSPAFRQMPGFTLEYGRPGLAFVLRSSRGAISLQGPACTPLIRIDGILADMEQLAGLAPRHVEAVEVYPSSITAPAEYSHGEAPCGLVLVWLRR